jgi:hypothetical protein
MNNPLLYTDPLGLWAIETSVQYKTRKNKDGNDEYVYDDDGNRIVDKVVVRAVKTKDDDDGASLAAQLGLKGKDAERFAAKINGGDDGIRLSGLGGDVGRVFGAVEGGLTEQFKWDARNPRPRDPGPRTADCSETACRIAFPQQMFGTLSFSVQEADAAISADGATRSVQAGDARVGDIVRWADARNNPKHFASFIFRNDNGDPVVFSKSGERGRYEIATTNDQRWTDYQYGTIRGINRGETGFYRPR